MNKIFCSLFVRYNIFNSDVKCDLFILFSNHYKPPRIQANTTACYFKLYRNNRNNKERNEREAVRS